MKIPLISLIWPKNFNLVVENMPFQKCLKNNPDDHDCTYYVFVNFILSSLVMTILTVAEKINKSITLYIHYSFPILCFWLLSVVKSQAAYT